MITDDEAAWINRLQEDLGIPDAKAQAEYEKQVRSLVKRLSDRVISRVRRTRRFSPDDEDELRGICANLKVTTNFDMDGFRVYRHLWEAEETGRLSPEPIAADIRLGRDEDCYHCCPAIWLQMRTVRERHGSAGRSISFRVAKGMTLRFGQSVPITTTREELEEIARGSLYITNKKLVFIGSPRSTNITYGRLAQWQQWSDAIEVIKTTGRPDVFKIEPIDVEYVDGLLQTV